MEPKNSKVLEKARPAFLIVNRGHAVVDVVEIPLDGNITIGRADSNRVIIPDEKCSRLHCEIVSQGGQCRLRDLNSRNGVLLDGQRVASGHPISVGEKISIGSYTLLLADRPIIETNPGREPPAATPESSDFQILERKSETKYEPSGEIQHLEFPEDRATALFRIARAFSACDTEHALGQVALNGLITQCRADLGGVFIIPDDHDTGTDIDSLTPIAVCGDRPVSDFSNYLTQILLTDKQAILAQHISRKSALASQQSLHDLNAENAICAPIRHAGAILGIIHLYSTYGGSDMTQADLEFVLAVADQLGDQLHSLRERASLEVGLDLARRHVNDLQGQLGVETELVGRGPKLEELRRTIARVAPTGALVLIRGESGVGKELVARAVHQNSHRKDGPFVCVNCAALSESLLESELFGHEKGAFTGASHRRAGKFEQANGGTLFLDEIGETSPEIQAKFLRVLEGQPFERVGGGTPITVDVRVVTATNRDLEQAVREGRLRRDLFFRLQVIEVTVPSLRQHPEDIPAIAQHFLARFSAQSHRRLQGFSQAALQKLQTHSWPGNVRELRNVVERAVILAENDYLNASDIVLTKLNLDSEVVQRPNMFSSPSAPIKHFPVEAAPPSQGMWDEFIHQNKTLDDIDRLYIEAVLKATYWNKSKASRILQIERTTLDRRLKKYGLARPDGMEDSDDDIKIV